MKTIKTALTLIVLTSMILGSNQSVQAVPQPPTGLEGTGPDTLVSNPSNPLDSLKRNQFILSSGKEKIVGEGQVVFIYLVQITDISPFQGIIREKAKANKRGCQNRVILPGDSTQDINSHVQNWNARQIRQSGKLGGSPLVIFESYNAASANMNSMCQGIQPRIETQGQGSY